MFESESLLNESDNISEYRQYCTQVVHYTVVETFYIFTVCNLVQSSDQRTFYRERVHHMSSRMLYLLADINFKVSAHNFRDHLAPQAI
jgi:hypothetical protein